MLKHFLELLIAHIQAVVTVFRVYVIGVCYAVCEFYTDYNEKLKFVPKNKVFKSKVAEWKSSSSMLKGGGVFEHRKATAAAEESAANEDELSPDDEHILIAVLTGADGTIGLEILDYLLSLDFYVFVIGMQTPQLSSDQLHFVQCDLSDRRQVFEAIESVQLCASHIDLLLLNAAMMLCPDAGWLPFRMDCFGHSVIEPHLAVNVLANAQLFASLAQRLERSQLLSPRAVFLSSCTAHAGDLALLLEDEEKFWCRRVNDYKAYADSKLLLSIYVKYLSRILKYRQSKIAVVSVHPGVVPGKLYRNVFGPFRLIINIFLRPFLRSALLAATRVLDMAFSDDVQEGSYYEDGRITTLKRMDDSEFVWSVGTSVRDMIVDSSDNSFNTEEKTK